MSDSLHRMFDEASQDAPPDPLDLDAVISRARGVQRRRRISAAGSLAVLALAVVVVPQILPTNTSQYDMVAEAVPSADTAPTDEAAMLAESTTTSELDVAGSGTAPVPTPDEDAARLPLPPGEVAPSELFSANDAAAVAVAALPGFQRADEEVLSWLDGMLALPIVGPTGQAGELVIIVTPTCAVTSSGLDLPDADLAAVEEAVCAAYAEAGSPVLP
jgi:cell division septation protein DedD